jgi:hypothetical protein
MWLKSALQEHYDITRKGHSGHLNKITDELLNKIILMDCAVEVPLPRKENK